MTEGTCTAGDEGAFVSLDRLAHRRVRCYSLGDDAARGDGYLMGRLTGMPTRRGYLSGVAATLSSSTR